SFFSACSAPSTSLPSFPTRRSSDLHFVIATGSHPRSLAIPGGELAKISDDVFDIRVPPKRMVIIGAGVVACEFAFVFARLGSARSEEHTSELQSRSDLVCRLLLEKK